MSRIKQLGVFHIREFGLCAQWPEKPKHQIIAMLGDAVWLLIIEVITTGVRQLTEHVMSLEETQRYPLMD